ncbi:hypothetical protein BsWGS_12895 [Bradybaena similaris]
MASRDPASNQLSDYQTAHPTREGLTTESGAFVGSKLATASVGPRGPTVLQDHIYIDEQAHFDRERIPERVVHAKGAGAFGEFEVTHDITKYTKAGLFSQIGKKTPMVIRFSTVGGESGSADTVRDPRGFAVKFYTEDGNYDLVGNNTPIFFIRDAILFPSFIHTQKRNPTTHLKDPDMFWDFMSLRPETVHQTLFMFSDRGIPDGYRYMNGYGSHTFKLVNKNDEAFFCKFHFKTNQGIKNIPVDKAEKLVSSDPDYSIRDLYNSIARKEFPSWTLYIQVMTEAEGFAFKEFNPFDLTKVWPHDKFPLIPVGKMTLNRNPKNYFTDVEQAAYSPSHFVPGIEASPDKMLQGRLFAYNDTHRHRLGPNFIQIPVNCPYRSAKVRNYQRDGPATVNDNQEGAPNYFPNSFNGPLDNPKFLEHTFSASGEVKRHADENEDDVSQPRTFYQKVLKPDEQKRLAQNIAGHIKDTLPRIQDKALENFKKVDPKLYNDIRESLKQYQ